METPSSRTAKPVSVCPPWKATAHRNPAALSPTAYCTAHHARPRPATTGACFAVPVLLHAARQWTTGRVRRPLACVCQLRVAVSRLLGWAPPRRLPGLSTPHPTCHTANLAGERGVERLVSSSLLLSAGASGPLQGWRQPQPSRRQRVETGHRSRGAGDHP